MRVLVVGTPQFPIPPDQLLAMADAGLAWFQRYQDQLEAFGNFPGGGGFGVVDVDDAETLNQMLLELPFVAFSRIEVRPVVPGETAFRQLRDAAAAMSGQTPAQ